MRFIAHLMHHACSKLGRVDKSGISRVFCRAQIDAHIAMHILPIAMHGECLRRALKKYPQIPVKKQQPKHNNKKETLLSRLLSEPA